MRDRYVRLKCVIHKRTIHLFLFISFVNPARSQQDKPDTLPVPQPDTITMAMPMQTTGHPDFSGMGSMDDEAFQQMLLRVEEGAADPARAILTAGRKWVYEEHSIIRGSCWDFVNEIFRRTGHESQNRTTVFRSAERGPYADADLIRPGDWIYHRNYSYRNIPHSAIFIGWVDRDKRIAYTLSYAGEGRRSVARYLKYDLRKVYQIVRPGGI
jgi:hypothetical protein